MTLARISSYITSNALLTSLYKFIFSPTLNPLYLTNNTKLPRFSQHFYIFSTFFTSQIVQFAQQKVWFYSQNHTSTVNVTKLPTPFLPRLSYHHIVGCQYLIFPVLRLLYLHQPFHNIFSNNI